MMMANGFFARLAAVELGYQRLTTNMALTKRRLLKGADIGCREKKPDARVRRCVQWNLDFGKST